jgi:hypothetical protein
VAAGGSDVPRQRRRLRSLGDHQIGAGDAAPLYPNNNESNDENAGLETNDENMIMEDLFLCIRVTVT